MTDTEILDWCQAKDARLVPDEGGWAIGTDGICDDPADTKFYPGTLRQAVAEAAADDPLSSRQATAKP